VEEEVAHMVVIMLEVQEEQVVVDNQDKVLDLLIMEQKILEVVVVEVHLRAQQVVNLVLEEKEL
jgi:exoribonuclease R